MFNSFYQWVALSLIGQALLFYCPRAVWLSLEGSLMKHLASSECRSKVVEEVEEKCDTLVDTFTVHLRNKYNRYFFAFLGCEILNLVMVVTQVIKISDQLDHTKRCLYINCVVFLEWRTIRTI